MKKKKTANLIMVLIIAVIAIAGVTAAFLLKTNTGSGLGSQLRQGAGKQRYNNFGGFGMQFDHRAAPLQRQYIDCILPHFTGFVQQLSLAMTAAPRYNNLYRWEGAL